MKKKISLLVVSVLIISMLAVLTACGGSSSGGGNEEAQNNAAEEAIVPDAVVSNPGVEVLEEYGESVIEDNEYCSITVTGLVEDTFQDGYGLNLLLKNKTDKDFELSLGDVSVNGFMCINDRGWVRQVSAGQESDTQIMLPKDHFEAIGAAQPFNFDFHVYIYDPDDMMADSLVDKYYSYGVEGGASSYSTDDMELIFDNGVCALYVVERNNDPTEGYTMKVYLENHSNLDLEFLSGAVINYDDCFQSWWKPVSAGKNAVLDINWPASVLEENGVTNIEKITFDLTVSTDPLSIEPGAEEYSYREKFVITP
ncbi:MAG: hypothetical protein IKZ95_03330 [Lachnospiraceae bacterium]|nr:hypothetical protein [Lachnospiraceae bacterium]